MMTFRSNKQQQPKLSRLFAAWLTMTLLSTVFFFVYTHIAIAIAETLKETENNEQTRRLSQNNDDTAKIDASLVEEEQEAFSTNSSFSANTYTPNIMLPYVPVSAIIPATLDRMNAVNRLLESIAAGTHLPQEVILAISPQAQLALNLTIPKGLYVKILGSTETQNAAQNRNRGAEHATMPVLAYVDSDDIVGTDWIETVFSVFNSQPIDALLHKWFYCRNNMPRKSLNNTWKKSEQNNMIIANDIFPSNLSQEEAWKWVAHPKQVRETSQMWDPGYNHPWWTLGHVSVKRDVYMKVKQNENAVGHEDALFTADLLLQEYKVATIKNQLTGYCKQ